jgi:hypothetical protein
VKRAGTRAPREARQRLPEARETGFQEGLSCAARSTPGGASIGGN